MKHYQEKKKFSVETIDKLYHEFETENNNPKLASIVLLFKADFMNDPEAQTKIGRCYIENYIFNQNQQLGFQYLQRAADQNCIEAKFHLGIAYKYGHGVCKNPENDKKSLDLINEASRMGYEPAKKYIDNQANIEKNHIKNKKNSNDWII